MIRLFNKSSIVLLTLILFLTIIFVVVREHSFNKQTKLELAKQAKTIAISLWKFEKEVCNSNCNFFSSLNKYRTLKVIDYTGAEFTSSDTLELTKFDRILYNAKLIRVVPFTSDIVYEGVKLDSTIIHKKIGIVNIEKYNFEIYNYLYIFFVLFLLFLIYVAFYNLYKTNNNLEDIINEKTKKLRQSEEKLQITLNSICDGVLATDNRGRIVNMNPIAEKILGISLLKNRGKPAFELIHIKNIDTNKPIILQEESIISGKIEVLGKIVLNEEEKILTVTLSPIKDIQKNSVGVVYVFRDITNELREEEEARHSQKMESIGQLAGGIAHDFNNMLSGILGATELLEIEFDEATDADIFENISLIKSSANLAAELTNQLLLFSRKNSANFSEFSVQDMIKNTILLLQRSIDKKIEVNFVDLCNVELFIQGDKSQLSNALLNLGVNARDALEGEGTIDYIVSNTIIDESDKPVDLTPGNYAMIQVKDTGSGMSKELIKKIFEPFFTTKEKGKGTGLGLAAVYNSIKEHGGTISVKSEIGQGSDFTIYLPLLSDEEHAKHPLIAEKEPLAEIKSGKTILLVEDENLILKIEKKMLEKQGYKILVASNGEDAVKTYSEHFTNIDLVLMDFIMPRLNGKDAYLKMREINSKVRVVIMSGNINESIINELKLLGIEDYIKKPFQWHEIQKILEK